MTGALLYLRLMSLRNMVLSRTRRLKQPKYLVGAIVGAWYFYFMFFRRAYSGRPGTNLGAMAIPPDVLPVLVAVGALLLVAIAALNWIMPDQRAGLTFSEAEIAFLFPAPFTRRTLIYYKLLSSQLGVLFTALIFTLLTRRWGFLGGNPVTHAIGWWFILSTLNLHMTGAAFVVTRLMDKGITSARRRLTVLGIFAVVAVVTLAWLWRDLRAPRLEDFADYHTMANYAQTLLTSGPLPWLLLPAKLVLGPFFAPDLRAFFLALGPALLVFLAHGWWVLRSEVSFEDASIAKSEKRAARIAAVREGNWRAASGTIKARPAPFRLAATGRPEIAFLWKNLLSTFTWIRPRAFGIMAAVIVLGCQWLERSPDYRAMLAVIGVFALICAAYTLFLGPQIARQDLRSDLLNTDILKTYPLRGWQVVLGEMLTPIAILTAFLWLALLTLMLSFHPHSLSWLTPELRIIVGLSLVPLLPVLCALQLLVPNAATLLFPAWAQSMRNRTERGIEMMGQRLIFVGGQFLVLLFVLLPAALGGFALIFATQWLIGSVAAVAVAALAVLVILVAEVWCGLWWIGERFEKFDLSAELRP
jgi:ABC-2 type transport system permease protein